MIGEVLLIEDDDDIAALIERQIQELGLNFVRAADGEAGLEKALAEQFDLILLDIMLPKLEGVEVCKEIRDKNKRVPIVMLTAKDDIVSEVLLFPGQRSNQYRRTRHHTHQVGAGLERERGHY